MYICIHICITIINQKVEKLFLLSSTALGLALRCAS